MAPIGNVTSTDDLSPSYSATMAPYSVTSAQYEPTFYTTLAPTSAGFGLSECMDWLTLVAMGVGVTIGVVYAIWRRRRGCNRSRQQQQHGPVQLTDMPGRSKSRQQQYRPLTDTPDLECSTSDVQSQDIYKKEEMRGYVKRYYSDEPDKAKGLLERIESSENLSTLAESPVLLLWMCSLWREDSALPQTMSWLYNRVIKYLGEKEDVSKEEMSRVLIALGKVGLRGLLSPDQELTFKESDFEQSLDIRVGVKVGILTTLSNSVQFIHKTFQEFSAAAYLQNMFKESKREFRRTLNEIMWKDPLAFEYLLRFCCGDNEACTLEILKVFPERHEKDLSFDNKVGHMALHCYFEGQCKCLPPEEFIDSFLTDLIKFSNLNNDSANSVRYFLQRIAKETKACGSVYLAKVKEVVVLSKGFLNVSELFGSGLPNLVTLNLFGNDLGGTVESWCKQLGQCKALQDLNLGGCSLNGQDMVHVAELLSGLPNLVRLDLTENDLGGTAESWCKQLGQCKALQHLNLGGCSLNGQDMVHVAESLSGLPNLVRLDLTRNDLGGTAESWCKQLGQCKALQHLNLDGCSLNGQDMIHVAESLSGLLKLNKLHLSGNDLCGAATAFCAKIKKFKALDYLNLFDCKVTSEDDKHIIQFQCETNIEVNYS